jgi:hypothetical protein
MPTPMITNKTADKTLTRTHKVFYLRKIGVLFLNTEVVLIAQEVATQAEVRL